jgi:hypothetical protein
MAITSTSENQQVPSRPEAGATEPCPDGLNLNTRHQELVPDVDCGVLGLVCVRRDDFHCSLGEEEYQPGMSQPSRSIPNNLLYARYRKNEFPIVGALHQTSE